MRGVPERTTRATLAPPEVCDSVEAREAPELNPAVWWWVSVSVCRVSVSGLRVSRHRSGCVCVLTSEWNCGCHDCDVTMVMGSMCWCSIFVDSNELIDFVNIIHGLQRANITIGGGEALFFVQIKEKKHFAALVFVLMVLLHWVPPCCLHGIVGLLMLMKRF